MKIRTQLVAAFLLLAIVPLTSLVLYSYFTSIRAVQRAVEAESNVLTAAMNERMEASKEDLRRRFGRLGDLSFAPLLRHGGALPAEAGRLAERLMTDLGDAAPFVEKLMLIPGPPPAPPRPGFRPPPAAPRPPASGAPPEAPARPAAPSGETEEVAIVEVEEAPVVVGDPEVAPMVIHMPRLMAEYGEVTAEIESEGLAAEDVAAISRAATDLVALGLRQAAEAMREYGSEAPLEAEAELESQDRELERQARLLERRVEKLQARIARQERERVIAALKAEELPGLEAERLETERLLGQEFGVEIRERGEAIGTLRAQISAKRLIHRVLGSTPRDQGEVPFALAADGTLFLADEADRPQLEELGLYCDPETGAACARLASDEWVIASLPDPESGLVFAVARPITDSLAEIRRTTARNLGFGLGLIGLALLGILPLSRRISRGLESVTAGAERIARGDLSARVPVESGGEIGQLAAAFNHMAEDLRTHQERLLEEEGRRHEQELEKRFLEAEYERKSRELEDARQFQLSLLPKTLPRHPAFDVAVDMQTATEVGGDYYDFHLAPGGPLTVAIGDATGHGARAGTMVTVVKSLFSSAAGTPAAGSPAAPDTPLAEFLQQAARTVKRMDLGRMAMALTVARFDGRTLHLAAAGMPPALLHRAASGEVEELALAGMPLGGLASDYREKRVELDDGDTLLLLSDGLPELPNREGEPLGYGAVRTLFADAAGKAPAEVIAELTAAASRWTGGEPPGDDMTFVVVRKKPAAA